MSGPGPGWFAVLRSDEVGSRPVPVQAQGVGYTAFRPAVDAPVAVVAQRCPHRLVRLAHGRVIDGTLQCPYHGWRFGPDGSCGLIPSAGPGSALPPRADLAVPWGVREQDGWIWVAPAEPGQQPEPDERARSRVLTNLDDSLQSAWHPVALAAELGPGGLDVLLLARSWRLTRGRDGTLAAADPMGEPPAAAIERFGVLWLAPRPPRAALIEVPEDGDPEFAKGWLAPERSQSAAGLLAENFLDVAHFPFVHAGTFGAAEEAYVPSFEVALDADGRGLTSDQDQWFDNAQDPAVVAGLRPLRQRRRARYRYRWPFQLVLRLEELDAGAVKTILFLLQPQDAGSTRIYTKMLLHGVGGVPVPGPAVLAAEIAFEVAVLAEDLALQRAMTAPGLPLRLRDELHVRSDRSGVALRRVLAGQLTGA